MATGRYQSMRKRGGGCKRCGCAASRFPNASSASSSSPTSSAACYRQRGCSRTNGRWHATGRSTGIYRQQAEPTDDPIIKTELLELASVCEEVAITSRIISQVGEL